MRKSYITGIIVCSALTGVIISGCGKDETKTAANEIVVSTASVSTAKAESADAEETVSAEEIINGYMEKGFDNYRLNITYNSQTEMRTGDDTMIIPTEITVDSKRAGNYAYEVQTMKVDYEELPMDYADETYMVLNDGTYTMYSSVLNQKNWFVSKTEDPKEARVLLLNPDDFKNASCSLDEENGIYTVTEPLEDLSENSDFFLDSLKSNSSEENGVIQKKLEDTINDGRHYAVYSFTADNLELLSIEYDPIEYTVSVKADDKETSISNRNEVKVKLSDYGKINEKKVKVSNKIKNKAKKNGMKGE